MLNPNNWKPISELPISLCHVYARDSDGNERWTYFDQSLQSWLYDSWRETEDHQEYETEEFWEPIEYKSNR